MPTSSAPTIATPLKAEIDSDARATLNTNTYLATLCQAEERSHRGKGHQPTEG